MTVETKNWEVTVNDDTVSALVNAYYSFPPLMDHNSREWKAYKAFETALVAMGLLEADGEEPEEESLDYTNEAQSLDEWIADQRYDAYRDYDLAMGYER